MAKRIMASILVLWIAVTLVAGETDAAETLSSAAEAAKDKAEDIKESAGETAKSWTDWAIHKFNEAWGSKSDDGAESTQGIADKAGEAASKSTATMQHVASESAGYASDKASAAANVASEHMGDAKEYLSVKADNVADMASDAKDTVHDAFSTGWDKAGEMFGVEKLGDVYPTIGDTMAQHAKNNYELAKEKVSQTAGDRKESSEL
ncbi:hypothetical protein Dimus_017284 [Dionaea muscipula]